MHRAFEIAGATRTCSCGAKILKGEEHYAFYKKGWHDRYATRTNFCMLCVLKNNDPAYVARAQKYLDEHKDVHNRLFMSQIKNGRAL